MKPRPPATDRQAPRALAQAVTLDQQLEALEQKWFAIFQAEFANKSLPPSASGEIQFFSTDFPRTYLGARDEPIAFRSNASGSALCVICIGMNYNTYRHRAPEKIAPHIYTAGSDHTWTFDDARTRSTRRALNSALAEYATNRQQWTENGFASNSNLLPATWDGREAQFPLVVIKTQLSPFILTKPWAEFSDTVRRETVDAWNPNRHLCDLIQTLGNGLGLCVVHGNHVWPHFLTDSREITNWLLTPTLTYESDRNRSISNFWRPRRPEQRPAPPLFPCC